MSDSRNYKRFVLLLDLDDEDDKKLIKFLEEKHGTKQKNSYSTKLRKAVEAYMKFKE